MTSLLEYGVKGRRIWWAASAYVFYNELTDDDLGLGDVTATINFAGATVSLFIPDPVATALGWGWTRLVNAVRAGGNSLSSGWRGIGTNLQTSGSLTIMRQTILVAGIVHTATLPWQIQNQQIKAQKEGDINFNADLKLINDPMNWQPERYPMNRPNNPMGSRSI